MNFVIYDKDEFVSVADELREGLDSEEKFSFPNGFIDGILKYKNNWETKSELVEYTSERNTSLMSYIFSDCEKLKKVDCPNVVHLNGSNNFNSCDMLTDVNLPKVENITESAFSYCKSLESIDLPCVTEIRGMAFNGCVNLTNITAPNLVTIDEHYAFQKTNLNAVDFPKLEHLGYGTFFGCANLKSVNLPNVITIQDYAFKQCSSVKSIDLPNATSLWDFEDGAGYSSTFEKCTSLETINIPNVTSLGDAGTTSGRNMFAGCSNLKALSAPKATTIGQYCFDSCHSLKSVDLPLVAGTLGSYNFMHCYELLDVNTPNAEKLPYLTFKNCYSLRYLHFPKVDSTSSHTFQFCKNLETVVLDSITSMNDRFFVNTPSLRTVVIRQPDSICTLGGGNVFQDTKISLGEGFIYVPDTLVDGYKAATNWVTYADQIKPLSEYIPCTAISLNATELTFTSKQDQTLTATITPSNSTDNLSWSSSDLSVACVVNGVVKPKKNGTTTITAYCGSQRVTCDVTISGIEQNTYDGILYQLSESTYFSNDRTVQNPNTALITAIKLSQSDISFTIMADITSEKQNSNFATIFHCQTESGFGPGYKLIVRDNNTTIDYLAIDSFKKQQALNIPNHATESNFKIILTHEAGSGSMTLKYLYNGVVSEVTNTFTWSSSPKTLWLGAQQNDNGTGTRYWTGAIHEFVVLNRVITDNEIAAYLV